MLIKINKPQLVNATINMNKAKLSIKLGVFGNLSIPYKAI